MDLCLSKSRERWVARCRLFAMRADYEQCEPAVGGRVIIALSHYSRSYREWWSETVPCFRPRYRLACKKWSVSIKNASKSGCCARLDPRAGFTRPLRFVCGQRNCACGRGGSWADCCRIGRRGRGAGKRLQVVCNLLLILCATNSVSPLR